MKVIEKFEFRKLKGILAKWVIRKGSITVESAIILPVFLFVILSLISIIKIVYVHEMMQYALAETAGDMASSAYILRVSGLQDLNSTINNGLDDKAKILDEHLNGYNDFCEILSDGEEALSNPLEEIKSIAVYFLKGAYGDVKTEMLIPIVRLYMEKYLTSGSNTDIDKKLKSLCVENGIKGLDFSDSHFFCNENDDIDIIVRYTISIPVPIKIMPKLKFVQRASARAWLGGDDPKPVIKEGGEVNEDIWSMDNFSRGRIIRSRFGANLPFSFPVIAKYDGGKAVMIKSVDTLAMSYQTGDNLKETLMEYIDSLAGYDGQEEPWGSKNIAIHKEDILSKELLLIIPENDAGSRINQILEECRARSSMDGISLVIEKYGIKNTRASNDNESESESEVDSER